jgi:DNA-binding transcriptional LysR family regulator
MNWSDIQLFEAAAGSGSLSAGARSLGISQPQMSRRLQQLEQALGVRLFDRTPQGLRPTPAGRRLIPLAEQMRTAADAIERVKPDLASTHVTVVRISVDEIREKFLTCHIARLAKELHDIELEIFSGHIHPDHASRKTDVQIRSCLPDSESLVAKRLGRTRYGLYGHEDLIAAHGNLESDESLRRSPWIGIAPDHLWYPEQKRWLEEFFSEPSELRFNTMTGVLNAARMGVGLALLPSFMAENHPELERLECQAATLETVEYLVVHRDLLREPAIRRTVNALATLYRTEMSRSQSGVLKLRVGNRASLV